MRGLKWRHLSKMSNQPAKMSHEPDIWSEAEWKQITQLVFISYNKTVDPAMTVGRGPPGCKDHEHREVSSVPVQQLLLILGLIGLICDGNNNI